ncbi:MAG: Hsp20/alpha crystallin family protein [Victivallales bacterium]|nr:Hsp20/alpha crystallin family protein [Victivallales bacterium]MBR5078994.1 Hsp20/alpha crystallin family protein [Victivallales bacterium]MBR5839129.1 Hsp20/alpha crystallin family protein [Victivallales bacterium]
MWKTTGTLLWDPWRELMNAGNGFDELLNGLVGRRGEFPPTNVWMDENKIEFAFELPGMKAENLDVTAKHDTLTIKGKRDEEALPEGAMFLRQERGAGYFSRSFSLPFKVDSEKVEARYVNGILKVTLPKASDVMPKKINVING